MNEDFNVNTGSENNVVEQPQSQPRQQAQQENYYYTREGFGSSGYNQNSYGQNSYGQNGYAQNNYGQRGYEQEPPKKKSGVGKILAITLAMVVVVGIAAIGGYSAHTIYEKLAGIDTGADVEAEKPEDSGQKITVVQPEQQSGSSSVSNSGVILTDVSAVVERVMPTSVAITNSGYYTQSSGGFGFWGGGGTTQIPTQSSGSGIIIGQNDTELLIVTNNHVIENNESLTVQFIDGATAEATVKGADASVDIAIVAVPLDSLMPKTRSAIAIAVIGDSGQLKMGQGVIAIGNAMGYGQSCTTGCISALERQVTTDQGTTLKVLQTDAAINPGNSGGALLNQNGEVIGINTAKLVDDTAEGIGYAIPISSVLDLINDMMNWETMEKVPAEEAGFIGIQNPMAVDSQSATMFDMPMGVYAYVMEGGPAEKAGMLTADIIVGVDRYTILDVNDLTDALAYFRGGDTVTVTVKRLMEGKYQDVELQVTLGFKKDYTN